MFEKIKQICYDCRLELFSFVHHLSKIPCQVDVLYKVGMKHSIIILTKKTI